MPYGSPRRPRSPRARLLTAATLVCGALAAGCGAATPAPTTATDSARATRSGATVTTLATTAAGSHISPALAFAKCMRADGVPNFPDPVPGSGFKFSIPSGSVSQGPAFRSAQAKCQPLIGSFPAFGSTTHPTDRTLAKLVRIAQCMRRHGIAQFPDPRTNIPADPSAYREITDFDGAILLFPGTLDMQAPAYRQALTACGAPPLGLRH